MNTFESDDNALEDPHSLSLGSLTEDKNQASTSVSCTNTSSESEHKVSNVKENKIRIFLSFNLYNIWKSIIQLNNTQNKNQINFFF